MNSLGSLTAENNKKLKNGCFWFKMAIKPKSMLLSNFAIQQYLNFICLFDYFDDVK